MDLTMLNSRKSIVEVFVEKTLEHPDRIAITLISDDNSEENISYGQLHSKAISCARTLQSNGIKKQDIVIICLNHSSELVAAFWGILYVGAIPVISHYPEHVPNRDKFKEQICSLVRNSGARGIITLPDLRVELGDSLRDLDCQAISANEILTRPVNMDLSVPEDYASGEQVAHIQYTSGSTGRQKGVRLSHRAILNFIQSYAVALDLRPQDVIVNWPPLYHDLGLFSGVSPTPYHRYSISLDVSIQMGPQPEGPFRDHPKAWGNALYIPQFWFKSHPRECEKSEPEGTGSQHLTICRPRRGTHPL